MLGELNKEQIEHLLKNQTIGRIGIHADEKTYVVPVTYVFNDSSIYAHSRKGLKIEMMRKNPKVCFEIDAVRDMANWESVIAWGDYEEILDNEQKVKTMKMLVEKIRPLLASETVGLLAHAEEHKRDVDGMTAVVFRLKLREFTGRFEKN